MITENTIKDLREIVNVGGVKKYELIEVRGSLCYRIKALRDFGDVKKGDLGGFVESEKNLSHFGNCWVYGEATVYDKAYIGNNAKVKDEAVVQGTAVVVGDAIVSGRTIIRDCAQVLGCAHVNDSAIVRNNAIVRDDAVVKGCAIISKCARVEGRALVKDSAIISGTATITGYAVLSDVQCVTGRAVVTTDLSKNLKESIRCQTGLCPIGDYVIAYKEVNNNLTSTYDNNFKYEVGKWIEVDYENQLKTLWESHSQYLDCSSFEEVLEEDKKEPCSVGLHFSNAIYWNAVMYGSIDTNQEKTSTMLIARINLDDIITVQAGKIRCKRAYIMDSYKINY